MPTVGLRAWIWGKWWDIIIPKGCFISQSQKHHFPNERWRSIQILLPGYKLIPCSCSLSWTIPKCWTSLRGGLYTDREIWVAPNHTCIWFGWQDKSMKPVIDRAVRTVNEANRRGGGRLNVYHHPKKNLNMQTRTVNKHSLSTATGPAGCWKSWKSITASTRSVQACRVSWIAVPKREVVSCCFRYPTEH